MATLQVPEAGLSLRRGDEPGSLSSDPSHKPPQILRLNVAQNTLDDLVDSLRKDQKARLRLGKRQTLFYGSTSQHIYLSPEPPGTAELYRTTAADPENLYFTGTLSHRMEIAKAKEATAGTDEALAALEQTMSALKQDKESKKTHLITDIQGMRALGAGDKRSANGREAASLARWPVTKIDQQKERFFQNAANRSMPGSPSLGMPRSPASLPQLTPTSTPAAYNKQKTRLDALRVPLIHLLAIRAVSVKYLAQQTRASPDDCLDLVRKYGEENPLNREKFNLKGKYYKDLDVWHFPYRSQSDRDEAINNAVVSFDRQRISPSDKLWQMLEPKQDRGKGRCRSKFADLKNGPIHKAATPRIQVHASEEAGKDGYHTGSETDPANGRLTPKAAETAAAPSQRKRLGEKDAAPGKKAAPPRAKNTTLTGRVTKKTAEKKAAAKAEPKFKSAEFVHDSDDDSDLSADVAPPPKKPTATVSDKDHSKDRPKVQAEHEPTGSTRPPHAASRTVPQPQPQPQKGEARPREPKPTSTSSKTSSKPSPAPRVSKPASPQKPSPLGSSPPTNASDFENTRHNSGQTSSSSSSPLITQVARQPKKPMNILKLKDPRANGTKLLSGNANPLKRKAEPEPRTGVVNGRVADAKRRRPASSISSSDISSGSASPPLSRDRLRRELQEKSLTFKKFYAHYQTLHHRLAAQSDPLPSDLNKLERQHTRLQTLKKEIWDEDRRLRSM
jgi:RNA polymerase II elongation factor ELL